MNQKKDYVGCCSQGNNITNREKSKQKSDIALLSFLGRLPSPQSVQALE